MILFDDKIGLLNFAETLMDKGKIGFNFSGFQCGSTDLKWRNVGSGRYEAEQMECLFSVDIQDGVLSMGIENKGRKDMFLNEIVILCNPRELTNPPSSSAYREYIHSGGGSGVKKVGLANRYLAHNPESSMVYVLNAIEDNQSWLFAVLPPHRGDYVSFQALHADLHLEGNFGLRVTFCFQCQIRPGGKLISSRLECLTGADPLRLLEDMGEQWRQQLGRQLKPRKTGWNSWDYFAGAVTSQDIFANQDAARRYFGKRIEYFVIDEGWEPRWGVWEMHWKFPEGADGFCRRIREHGGVPGVWLAPLLVNCYTDLFRNHPDWFGRDEQGQALHTLYAYGPMAYMDVTHPEVDQWLYETFIRLRQAGFDYFKVDFSAEVLKCKLFRDRAAPRGMILRRAFETIRRAIGEEAYLLSCGAPYESVTGLVDAARTSGDIHNFWGHVLGNMTAISARWWMDGNLWNNDPDFLIIRSPETNRHVQLNREFARKPFKIGGWQAGRELSEIEVRTYALLIYAAAGDMFLGDDLDSLNERGIDLLRRILDEKPLERAARPLDLFAGHEGLPSLWLAEEAERRVLFVFNWEEDVAERVLDLRQWGLTEGQSVRGILGDQSPRIEDGKMRVRLEPRRGIALEFRS